MTTPSHHRDISAPEERSGSAAGLDYQLFLDCVHCGLCLSSCPTYAELGTETDGPRGRIYLMRSLADDRIELDAGVREHLDLCLGCRCCESACPSGVRYGKLIESFRIATAGQSEQLSWIQRLLLFQIFPHVGRTRLALGGVRLLQLSGLSGLLDRSGLLRWLPRTLSPHVRDAASARAPSWTATRNATCRRKTARPRRPVCGLCRRCRLPGHDSRNDPRASAKRLRGMDSPRPGLLRRSSLSCRA